MGSRIEGDQDFLGHVNLRGGFTPPSNAISNAHINPAAEIERSKLALDSLKVYDLPLEGWRVWDALASPLPATSSADDLGLYGGTFGSASPVIATGDVKNTTVTRYARRLVALPAEYEPGESITLRIHGGMLSTVSSGVCTVDVEAYKSGKNATVGADLCTTAAQSIKSLTFAEVDFVITPSGMEPGNLLDVRIAVNVVDSATATAVNAAIGATELLCDVRG